jgi:putative phosphoesterase
LKTVLTGADREPNVMKIGLISDTHGWIHPRLFDHFEGVDEIWHAGDIGNIETADTLAAFRPLRAVYGNIDDHIVRKVYKEHLIFNIEEIKVWITHIGGLPGHYDKRVKPEIYNNPPDLFICGHSHIARVMNDRKLGILVINPGSSGYNGFHKYMTAIRLQIDGKDIHDLELIELGERGKVIL